MLSILEPSTYVKHKSALRQEVDTRQLLWYICSIEHMLATRGELQI